MKIIRKLEEIDSDFCLTIGNFDGVHLGHISIITQILDEVKKNKLKICVMTFNPHPLKILKENIKNFLIYNYEKRKELLEKIGIDYLYEYPFNRDFSTQTPEEFINSFIINKKHLKAYFAGYDFSFGANKEGDVKLLEKICGDKIQILTANKKQKSNEIISSTKIRELIKNGNMPKANDFLGREFSITGVVIKGDGRGAKIGFPTANIIFNDDLVVPQKGVYKTKIMYNGMKYQAVTNIGTNPTFKQSEIINIETHILDFDNLIYGEKIEIIFLRKIRDEKKFENVNSLVTQIRKDIDDSKKDV